MGGADDNEKWNDVKARLPVGTVVDGKVVHVAVFGVFVDLGVEFYGLLRVPEMAGSGPKTMDDYPQVGESVTARVLYHSDSNRQIILIQRDIVLMGES